jgi:hypothetical protein
VTESNQAENFLWQADPLNSPSALTAIITQSMVADEKENFHPAKLRLSGTRNSLEFWSISLRPNGPTMVTLVDKEDLIRLSAVLDQVILEMRSTSK